MATKGNATRAKSDQLQFSSIGIDIGKDVFHIVGFDQDGKIVLLRGIVGSYRVA